MIKFHILNKVFKIIIRLLLFVAICMLSCILFTIQKESDFPLFILSENPKFPNIRKAFRKSNLYLVDKSNFYHHELLSDYPDCETFYFSKTMPVIIGVKDGEVLLFRIGRTVSINTKNGVNNSDLIWNISDLSKIWMYLKNDLDFAGISLPWQASYVAHSNFEESVRVLTIPYNDDLKIVEAEDLPNKVVSAKFGEPNTFRMFCHFESGRAVGIEFLAVKMLNR